MNAATASCQLEIDIEAQRDIIVGCLDAMNTCLDKDIESSFTCRNDSPDGAEQVIPKKKKVLTRKKNLALRKLYAKVHMSVYEYVIRF